MTKQASDCPIITAELAWPFSEPTGKPPRHEEGLVPFSRPRGLLQGVYVDQFEHEIHRVPEKHQSSSSWGPEHQTKSSHTVKVIGRMHPESDVIFVYSSGQTSPMHRSRLHDESTNIAVKTYWSSDSPLHSSAKRKEKALEKIVFAEDQEKLLDILTERGFSTVVEGFRQYLVRREKSLEDGESPGVNLDSLRAVARFLVSYNLPYSAIKADFEGNADLEWFLSSKRNEDHPDDAFWGEGDGQMILRFVSCKAIEFAVLSGPWVDEKERLSLTGTLSHSKMKSIIDMFKGRMVSYGKR